MRSGFRRVLASSVAALVFAASSQAQLGDYTAPRAADGHPDLNGIWQALNTAHYDLEAHAARPALALTTAPPRAEPPGVNRATPVAMPAPGIRALGAAGGPWRLAFAIAWMSSPAYGELPVSASHSARQNEN